MDILRKIFTALVVGGDGRADSRVRGINDQNTKGPADRIERRSLSWPNKEWIDGCRAATLRVHCGKGLSNDCQGE